MPHIFKMHKRCRYGKMQVGQKEHEQFPSLYPSTHDIVLHICWLWYYICGNNVVQTLWILHVFVYYLLPAATKIYLGFVNLGSATIHYSTCWSMFMYCTID